MALFKDDDGREWLIRLDAPTLSRLRSDSCQRPREEQCAHRTGLTPPCTGVDLTDLEARDFHRLAADPIAMCETVWLLVSPQANGTSYEQFGAKFFGETIDRATEALLQAIIDFFQPSRRALIKSVTDANMRMQKMAMERIKARIDDPTMTATMIDRMEKQIDAKLQAILISSTTATDVPDSSEFPPSD